MTSTTSGRTALVTSLGALLARGRAWLLDRSDAATAERAAGTAFLIRLASAAIAFASQAVLARCMGAGEFGVYVYVWTWVLVLGGFADLGLGTTAQRLLAQYAASEDAARLRGLLRAARAVAIASGALFAVAAIAAVAALESRLEAPALLMLASLSLPAYALVVAHDGIARSYGYVNLALAPPYVLRPLLVIALVLALPALGLAQAGATLAVACAVAATWLTAIGQSLVLDRRLARHVARARPIYDVAHWLRASLPILLGTGFYLLLANADILVLRHFRGPEDVARYYAAAKTLALVAFVYFAVSAAAAHKFAAYHVANDRERLRAFLVHAVKLTFWPSLAATVLLLALGKPILWLFGPDFVEAYPVMLILALGLLARAAVGPAERLLNMLDEQRRCAAVYAAAFAFNLACALALVPPFGLHGAAAATAAALVLESVLLFLVARRRLGLHAFIWPR